MTANNLNWWRGGVIYQIYPRSYCDSNGDGIGDLQGIISKLDYIASLNVDAIWLSPFFTSPMKDFGYDVSDYRDVDPMFGTLADFRTLTAKAHDLGLKVIIDQVYSHTSDQHEWFKESRSSKDNGKADWYVWADANEDGTPPNNWLSLFGGPAWQWDTKRQQYFQHNFLASQPDLNFHNREVQDAILDTARFWLELGVDGFRLDVVNMYFHDQALTDNAPARTKEQMFVGVDPANPFSRQYHVHQMCRDDNLDFLKRLRALLDEFPGSTTVGEIGAPDGLSYMAQYTEGNNKLHMAYTFELLSDECSPEYLRQTLTRIQQKLGDGWPSFALSNHDVVRSATRWTKGASDPIAKARAILVFLMTLRGSPCLYQGEELGLPEADVPYEELQDPFGIEFWPEFKGRDGCRTPMPWNNTDTVGFTAGSQPWLPVDARHKALSVSEQDTKPDSTLNFIRSLLAWRAEQPALRDGDFEFIDSDPNLLVYRRHCSDQTLTIAINLSEHVAELPSGLEGSQAAWPSAKSDKLAPFEFAVWSAD